MFKNYFKIALRNLAKNKVYSFINIAGLSIGLACAMLILLYTKDEVSYDKFLPGVNNIYRITTTMVNPDGSVASKMGMTGAYHGPAFNNGVSEIASYIRWQGSVRNIKKGTEIIIEEINTTDSNFFSVIQFPLLYGNAATALQQPNSVVLNETTAKKYFGTADVVGKILEIQDEEDYKPYLITAIAKDCPQNSSIQFQVLLPIEKNSPNSLSKFNWLNFHLNTFVVLSPDADVKKVESRMNQFYMADAKDVIKDAREKYSMNENAVYGLQPYTNMHLSNDYRADNGLSGASNPMYSYVLSGIVLFILLIACINFVNLTIARSLKRAREIGVRKVIGGGRRQLIFQFLGESYIICFVAFVFALGLAKLLLPFFNQLSNKALSLSYLLDVKLVVGYLLLFAITGFLAGFYPALVLSGFNPVQTLYNRFQLSGKNYLQKSLVVLQFSLATFLIIATLIIYKQFNYLTTKDLGYDDHNVLMISQRGVKYKDMNYFKLELLKNPNVQSVAFKNAGNNFTVAKVNGTQELEFTYEWIDENYLPLYKIPVVKGRNFSSQFPSDSTKSVMVNEAFVKAAGWKDPIGKIVDFWYNNKKLTVVGVLKDYHYQSLGQAIRPQLFKCDPANFGLFNIKLKEGTQSTVLSFIEQTYKSVFPISPYSYNFKDVENEKQYDSEAKWKKMMLFGAFLTIFISCIGLFGLSVLSAEKRLKEIGVRKVLGASVSTIVTALSKDFLKLVMISLFIALPVSWFLSNKWLQVYPYRTNISWWMFAMVGLGILLVALLTVCYQAIRAAVANPVKSLRTE